MTDPPRNSIVTVTQGGRSSTSGTRPTGPSMIESQKSNSLTSKRVAAGPKPYASWNSSTKRETRRNSID